MKRIHRKRATFFISLLLALLIAVPVGLTWRQVRQDRLNQALIAAVKRNDTAAVMSVLKLGADANCRDELPRKFSMWQTLMQVVRGRRPQPSHAPTPLLIALEKRVLANDSCCDDPPENPPLIHALLAHGAQVNQADRNVTPLLWAIWNDDNDSVRLLLEYGADMPPTHPRPRPSRTRPPAPA